MPVPNVIAVDDALLRAWPLPMPSTEGDKEERGRVLLVGGSPELIGAVVLAATAALRAGAGKVTVATGASSAALVAAAVPEARVIGLAEAHSGAIEPGAAAQLFEAAQRADALLIGPGMQDEDAVCRFVLALLPYAKNARVLLDAYAMSVVGDAHLDARRALERQLAALDAADDQPHPVSGIGDDVEGVEITERSQAESGDVLNPSAAYLPMPVLLTPHAGEMAHLTGSDKSAVVADPRAAAREGAERWNAVVALKGACTFVAEKGGATWQHEGGNVGLGISGSGDVLAGIMVGLLARGASLTQAAVWGVALHARAGDKLAKRFGVLGYLAREIAEEIPKLMHDLSNQR